MSEKAKVLVTATQELHTLDNQYFIKSVRGKAWELWSEGGSACLPHRLTRIPCKRVLWVIPMLEQEGGTP